MTDIDRALLEQPVRTQADLEAVWRTLMGPLGFSRGSLWFTLIGPDDRLLPVMNRLEDEGRPPTADDLTRFVDILRGIEREVAPGGRWAFLRSRPGRGGPAAQDRELIGALLAACRTAGVEAAVVHLATDDVLVPMPYDVLSRSA